MTGHRPPARGYTGALVIAVAILTATGSRAAELKNETLQAWNNYVHAAADRARESARPNGRFLWIDQDPDRAARVRHGEVLAAPVGPNPRRVPSGLIHDWIGAAFLPNATLGGVFAVVRDYSRYKEFYSPLVVASRPLAESGPESRFDMVMLNSALFSKTALDGEYDETYVPLSSTRWYSIARSTRIQQIEDYGQATECRLPPGQGSGYIWRLYSISKFEQRDGGVYIELEVMALSRDVPFSLRWLIDPVVRRVSRVSLATSLEKTRIAVSSSASSTAEAVSSLAPHVP